MKSKLLVKSIFVSALIVYSLPVIAGFAGGPYVIWANLSDNKKIDGLIKAGFKSRGKCHLPDSILFMKERPVSITNDLVKKSLVNKDLKSIKSINKILRKPYEEFHDGFDGVISYVDSPSPRFISLVTGEKLIGTEIIKRPDDENAIWDALCISFPPITRKP